MLLEIENQLHKRVHGTLGQSAIVIRLAEELDDRKLQADGYYVLGRILLYHSRAASVLDISH